MGRDPTKLTNKQETFVQGLIKGLSQRQAYIKAGYKYKKDRMDSLDQQASKLSKNIKVLSRYNKLMKEHKEKALWTREMACNELLEMLSDSKEASNFTGRYNSIKELNAVGDIYPKEIEVDISDPVYLAKTLKKLPKEKLEVLMNEFSKDY
ncbi:MAG: terminase small subunit [Bacteroidetes bacterium]|nr:terminase small subunit [Bacteroidota bacterium]